MRTVSLVATTDRISELFLFPGAREQHPLSKQGIMSAPFPVDPTGCKSKFGAWLAERTITTRRDDDLSILRITLASTQEDLHVREFAKSMANRPIKSAAAAEALHQRMLDWIEERRKVIAAYGDHCFQQKTVHFDWPVFGSAAAGHLATPEEYFDLCAKLIRQMRPVSVKTWDNEYPPESLGVTNPA